MILGPLGLIQALFMFPNHWERLNNRIFIRIYTDISVCSRLKVGISTHGFISHLSYKILKHFFVKLQVQIRRYGYTGDVVFVGLFGCPLG